MKNHKTVPYYNGLAAIACFCIVALHHNPDDFLADVNLKYCLSLAVVDITQSFLPIFFMLSGAKLVGYEEKYDSRLFFKRRFVKVFIPFLIFSFFSFALFCFRDPEYFEENSVFECIATTAYMPVYWFFVPLFLLYLLMPFITKVRFLGEKKILFLLGVLFVTEAIFPQVAAFTKVKIPFTNNGILYVVLYAVLGFYLSRDNLFEKHYRLLAFLAFACLLARYIWPWIQLRYDSYPKSAAFGYGSFLCMIPCVFYFLSAKKADEKYPRLFTNRAIPAIASCSFGIYLVHVFVTFFEKTAIKFIFGLSWKETADSWWYIFCFPLLTFILSLLSVHLSKKTGIGRRIFP